MYVFVYVGNIIRHVRLPRCRFWTYLTTNKRAHKSTKTTRNYNLSKGERKRLDGVERKKEQKKDKTQGRYNNNSRSCRRKAKLFVHAHKLQQLMYWEWKIILRYVLYLLLQSQVTLVCNFTQETKSSHISWDGYEMGNAGQTTPVRSRMEEKGPRFFFFSSFVCDGSALVRGTGSRDPPKFRALLFQQELRASIFFIFAAMHKSNSHFRTN